MTWMKTAGNIPLPFRNAFRGMDLSGGTRLLGGVPGSVRGPGSDQKMVQPRICLLESTTFTSAQHPLSVRDLRAAEPVAGLQVEPQAGLV